MNQYVYRLKPDLMFHELTKAEQEECDADCIANSKKIEDMDKNVPPIVGEFGYSIIKRYDPLNNASLEKNTCLGKTDISSSCGISFSSRINVNTYNTKYCNHGVILELKGYK